MGVATVSVVVGDHGGYNKSCHFGKALKIYLASMGKRQRKHEGLDVHICNDNIH